MIKSFKKRIGALVTVGPTVLWLGFFLMIPLIYVIGMSFLTKNAYGGVDFKLTLSNYAALFSSEYVKVFADSLWLSLETTVICLIVGYPFAYIIANASKKWKPALVLLLMLPFWNCFADTMTLKIKVDPSILSVTFAGSVTVNSTLTDAK